MVITKKKLVKYRKIIVKEKICTETMQKKCLNFGQINGIEREKTVNCKPLKLCCKNISKSQMISIFPDFSFFGFVYLFVLFKHFVRRRGNIV